MSPRWLHWPAAVSANDWDTFAIAVSDEYTSSGTTWVPGSPYLQFTPTGTAFEPDQQRFASQVQVRSGNVSPSYSTTVPYIAFWNATTSVWTVHAWTTNISATVQGYDPTSFEPAGASLPASGHTIRLVGLSAYTSGDANSWSNYA